MDPAEALNVKDSFSDVYKVDDKELSRYRNKVHL